MNTHIIVGDAAAKQLIAAQEMDEQLAGEIIVLQDNFAIGPIYVPDGETFTQVRNAYWQTITGNTEYNIADEAAINVILDKVEELEKVIFWMAPNIVDVSAFYWVLSYFQKYEGLLHVIFINNLPFFNEKSTLFYPKHFKEVLPREMTKCIKLLKDLSPADYEVDIDEWPRLAGENALVRIYEGNKKVTSKNEHHHDGYFLNQFTFNNNYVKAKTVMNQALNKLTEPLPEVFLQYRFRLLIAEGKLQVQGDAKKALKDFEVRKGGELQLDA